MAISFNKKSILRRKGFIAFLCIVSLLCSALVTHLVITSGQYTSTGGSRLYFQCSDTCSKAKDGVCDDGRGKVAPDAKSVPALCDLGTDCSDCSPWLGPYLSNWERSKTGPVSFAVRANASVRVRQSGTVPSFLMPITLAKDDPDVSSMLEHYGALEGGVTRVAHEILSKSCLKPDGTRGLVLDVGGNLGYFTLYAAAHGCRVIVWEPVPLFRAFLAYGAALNNVSHLVKIRPAAVGVDKGRVTLGVPRKGTYWGLASIDNLNLWDHEVASNVTAPLEALDEVVEQQVLLLKVDVEGYETQVMASAKKLLDAGLISNVLLEYSPGIFERMRVLPRDSLALCEQPRMLMNLLHAGFRIGHLPTGYATPWPPKDLGYGAPLPAFEEVTRTTLVHDLEACSLRQAHHNTCDIPKALKAFVVWRGCKEWAAYAHPKGFRSSFGFNTNLWASRDKGMLQLNGVAALFDEKQDMKIWTSLKAPGKGIGMLDCNSIGDGHKVLFRCNCTAAKDCGQQASTVQDLSRWGLMPIK